LNGGDLSDLLDMRIGDLTASNDRYLQTHCLS
jgi:hypothetical protein